MNKTLSVLNKKLSTQVKQPSKYIFTKEMISKLCLSLLFSTLVFTVKFNLGPVFMAPILCSLLVIDKKLTYYTMGFILCLTLFFDYRLLLPEIITFVMLGLLIKANKKVRNLLTLIISTEIAYLFNTMILKLEFDLVKFLFILLFVGTIYLIYYKALEMNYHKKSFLFKEDILAILTLVFNMLIGLFTIQLGYFNFGYALMVLFIMALGIMTNKINTICFSLISFCLLYYSGLYPNGLEVIPVIGVISTFIPQLNLKTFLYFTITPFLYYLGFLTGELIPVFYMVAMMAVLFYFTITFINQIIINILVPKYEDAKYYQIYVENFREDVSRKLLNFAELFNAFANKSIEPNNELVKLDEAIDEIIDKHCKTCLKKELCHNINHIKTYNYFSQILKEGDNVLSSNRKRFLDLFGMFCFNAFDVINSAIELNQEYLLGNKKHNNSSLLFQSQLKGLANILQEYAIEVNTDYESDTIKMEKIRDKLIKLGINIAYLKINNIKEKNIDLDFGIRGFDESYIHLIGDLINDILKEEVEIIKIKKGKGLQRLKVTSKRMFELEFGTSYIGKDGSRISGDNYFKYDMHNGNTIVALSDGMGNGYSAHIESKSTLELLNKMLTTGADSHTAVSIINTLLSLKEYNERFSTLDFISINKSIGLIEFYKIGSAPSFIVRGNRVIRIDNENLPVGITNEIDQVRFDIEASDIIVIVSDGVVERFNNINKFEKIIVSIARNSSIQIARDIIRAAITEFGGKIADDMTVIVIKVKSSKYSVSA